MSLENVESDLKRLIDKLHEDFRNQVGEDCGYTYTASIRKGSLKAIHEKKITPVQSFNVLMLSFNVFLQVTPF